MAEQEHIATTIDDFAKLKERQKTVAAKLAAAQLPPEEIDLHELQIKLEKIRGYVKRTEMRIAGETKKLEVLREKRMVMESKRIEMTVVKIGKHDQNI